MGYMCIDRRQEHEYDRVKSTGMFLRVGDKFKYCQKPSKSIQDDFLVLSSENPEIPNFEIRVKFREKMH